MCIVTRHYVYVFVLSACHGDNLWMWVCVCVCVDTLRRGLFAYFPFYNNANSNSCPSDSVSVCVSFDMLVIIQVAKGFTLHWSDLRTLAPVRCSRRGCFVVPGVAPSLFSTSPFLSLSVCLLFLHKYVPGCFCTRRRGRCELAFLRRNISRRCISIWKDPEMPHVSYLKQKRP